MAYASWSVVFGEQPSAAKWNILGTNDAFFDSKIGSGTAWTSYTPTLTNLTLGNGTSTGSYMQLGKIVFFKWIFTLGTTSAVGTNPTISLPVTSVAVLNVSFPLGPMIYDNNGGSGYNGFLSHASTTTAALKNLDTSNNFGGLTATSPTSFAANHKIYGQGWYEAA